ncbi:hypothetical protein [Nostoc parmelioides]|uniref:Uncharacterized protein n=1 Tax=Nostoc parmelioides FACHB-3921 TaxID=2692909 RepID=A0ABR8BDN2_9NOSO|nr:hypothetical protein [Nostoc parmelioides]MBD2250990.1 hypothetical protein [Nostoc parmelioides FACHB-3921]
MLGKNSQYYYHSTLGTVCVVPRPTLSSVNTKDGQPVSVNYPTNSQFGVAVKYFYDLKGIQVEDYKWNKPDLLVYELADGTLLTASKEVVEASQVNHTSGYHTKCYIHQVKDLQVLEKLPEEIEEHFEFI